MEMSLHQQMLMVAYALLESDWNKLKMQLHQESPQPTLEESSVVWRHLLLLRGRIRGLLRLHAHLRLQTLAHQHVQDVEH